MDVGGPVRRERISVIIPTYNRSSFIAGTLDSVAAQSVPVHEIIVVDDGSTDDTGAVVSAWETRNPSWRGRLHFLKQTNQGKSVALNLGLARVTGDWVAYNDSDDRWLPEKLEQQLRTLDRFPDAGACFTDAQFSNNREMSFTTLAPVQHLLVPGAGEIRDAQAFVVGAPFCIYMQTVLVRRDVMDDVGAFDTRFHVSQDTDFIFRVARRTNLCYVNAPLVEIDRTPGQNNRLTSEFDRRTFRRLLTLEMVFLKWLEFVRTDSRDLVAPVSRLLRGNRSAQANLHLQGNNPAEAIRCLRTELAREFCVPLAAKLALVSLAPASAVRYARRRDR